jgi:hypothetical protein
MVGSLIVACAVLLTFAFRIDHPAKAWEHRTVAVVWDQLEPRLSYLGSGGWELLAVSVDKNDPNVVWATMRRRGSAPAYRQAPVDTSKKKGRGAVPQYRESPL